MFDFNESHGRTFCWRKTIPIQSDMLRDALTTEGYIVDTAFSGDTACRKLNQHAYDLVILDVRMPGLNGGQVLRDFRSKHTEEPHTPVAIVSAFATGLEMMRFRRDGADACFSKPYSLASLLAECRRLIERRVQHVT
jgi:DNA-binding response OmpR family regulator